MEKDEKSAEDETATPQLEPDVEDDSTGHVPPGEAQDRRGPEPPPDELLPG